MRASESLVESIFEGAPWFVARLMADGPYESDSALLHRARELALAMPEEEQVALLAAHPRIGAPPASVSEASFREQGYDRGAGAIDLSHRLQRLNDLYEGRFGFRYVVFVNGRPREEIASLLEAGLASGQRDDEKTRGLEDVVAIAADRLKRIREGGA